MYYYVKGELVLKQNGFAVLDNGGIGYKIYTSANTLDRLQEGDKVTLYTHLVVREDVFDLYGFSSTDELSMFTELLGVSGVGPKAALAVLSVATPRELAAAVVTKDSKRLTKAQGVGAKMAQRIILELSDKLKDCDILPEEIKEEVLPSDNFQSDAVNALISLGYSSNEAKSAVSKVDPSLSTEEIIVKALAFMK